MDAEVAHERFRLDLEALFESRGYPPEDGRAMAERLIDGANEDELAAFAEAAAADLRALATGKRPDSLRAVFGELADLKAYHVARIDQLEKEIEEAEGDE